MATKKNSATTKTGKPGDTKGRTKNKNSKDRTEKGQFKKGHKVNEVWTEEKVLEKMNAVWKTLTTDFDGNPPEDRNIVRANDIKYLYEALLMHDVTKQQWNEWKEKFGESKSIADLFSKVKMLLECRLSYSGSSMDVLHLKQHYEYRDQQYVDATSKGEKIDNPFYAFLKTTGISNHQQT